MPETPPIDRTGTQRHRRGRLAALRRERRAAALRRAALIGATAAIVAVAGAAVAIALRGQEPRPEPDRAAASEPATPSAAASASIEPSRAIEPTASAEPTPTLPATITVAAVGDMIFDRQVKTLIAAEGGEAPLAKVAGQLAAADVAVGNLESPLSSGGKRAAGKEFCFRGDPRGISGLALAGFDALSLANNHALDYGPAALTDTIAALDGAGIAHSGAGPDRAAAWEPAVVETAGVSVAYLAFSHVLPPGFIATGSHPGIAQGRANMTAVRAAVAAAAEEHDYVIVSFHWGVEYKDDANAEQVRDARLAIDAGADLVMAHHPHVIQGIERYKGGMIAYSLGDFVFDHYSRKTGEAFILETRLGPHGAGEATVTPVYLDRYGRPGVVTGGEAATILERLRTVSAKHGTDVAIDGDLARVR